MQLKKLVLIFCFACVIAGAAVLFANFKTNPNQNQTAGDNYVETQFVESASGQRYIVTNPKRLDEVVDIVQYIVEGEIISIDNVQEVIHMREGTPERAITESQGQSPDAIRTGTNYVIRVTDSMKGELTDQDITLYLTEDLKGTRPVLKVGDRYIFMLNWNENIQRYIDVHPYASYIKVGGDKKVKPAYDMVKDFSELDNQSVDKVKKKLKDIAHKDKDKEVSDSKS